MYRFVFRPSSIFERASQSEELHFSIRLHGAGLEPEEGVLLDGTLPEVFRGFLRCQVEDESVELDLAIVRLIRIFLHHQRNFLVLEVQLLQLFPQEQSNLLGSIKHQHSLWSQSQSVRVSILSLDYVHIDTVHFDPASLVQIVQLRLGGSLAA